MERPTRSRLRQLFSGDAAIGVSVRLDSDTPPEVKAVIDKVIQSPLPDIAISLSGFHWDYDKGNFHHWRRHCFCILIHISRNIYRVGMTSFSWMKLPMMTVFLHSMQYYKFCE